MLKASLSFSLASLLLALNASASFALPVARLRSVRPVVEIADGQKAFRVAQNRNTLVFGDIVRTGVGGKTDILFNNGTQIALRERTQIQILAPATIGKPLVVRVFGALGEVFVRAKGPTEIRTAAGTAAVRGTQFLIQLNAPEQTTLTVSEGSVAFTNTFGEVLVNQNQQSSATTTSAPTPPVLIDPSGLLAWSFDITRLPATDLTPDETEALQLLQTGKATEAKTVLARDPEKQGRANAHAIAALALLIEGNAKSARSEARKAVELNPFSPFALLALGRSELGRGDVDEARQAFEQAAALSPESSLFQNELGAIYARLDLLPKARTAYTASLAVNPEDAVAIAGLATVEGKTGQVDAARKNFARALELAPQNASVRAQYANFLVERGQLKEAARIGRELLEIKGGSEPTAELGALYIRLSEASLFDQKLNDSLEYAKNAVKVLPDSAPANYQLGRVFLEQGRAIQAQNQFRYATILDPDFHASRYALGLVQDQIATGRNGQSALGSASSSDVSSQNSLFSVENAIQPGANERVQALVSDPTVARTASRSFGDLQIDAIGGSDSYKDAEVSYLKQSADGRSVVGINADYSSVDGIRPSANKDSNVAVASYGEKEKDSPSGVFFLLQNRRSNLPTNDGLNNEPANANATIYVRQPLLLTGLNWQKTQKTQARFLFQAGRSRNVFNNKFITPDINTEILGDSDDKNYFGEFRFDWRYASDHRLILGLTQGVIERSELTSTVDDFPDFDFFLKSRTLNRGPNHSTVAYVRDSWKLNNRWSFDSELKYRRLSRSLTTKVVDDFNGDITSTDTNAYQRTATTLPTFLATYRDSIQSQWRLRYSQRITDFASNENLAPDDIFLYSQDDIPDLSQGGRENRTDLEYTRNIGGNTLLQMGAFYSRQNRGNVAYGARNIRFVGLRSSVTGILSRDVSFSIVAEVNSAKGNAIGGIEFLPRDDLAGISRFRGEVGLQYLNDDGFFVQPSFAYIGYSPEGATLPDNRYRRRGGFALANLRVGKRYGLKYSAFAEIINLLDRDYTLRGSRLDDAGISRQLRLGISSRF